MLRKVIFILVIVSLLCSVPCYADEVEDLLNYYVKRFTPEKASLVIAQKPDKTGLFSDIFMDLEGVVIEKVRLDRLTFRMRGAQFNEPSNWKSGNVECKEAISVNALARIYDSDINRAIESKTFGKDGHWHDVSLAITPGGLKGRGYYEANAVLFNLDILLEIESGLRIVKAKELWLDNPQVKVNTLDVPDYITKKALAQIQPLIDLNKVPLPMSLHKVELGEGVATLSTRTEPKPLAKGLKYSYPKKK